jgi:hypothetical protein
MSGSLEILKNLDSYKIILKLKWHSLRKGTFGVKPRHPIIISEPPRKAFLRKIG